MLCAPEQVKGDQNQIGPLTDVYSLGVILFEMLTSRLPFRGSATEVMGQILYEKAPLPSELVQGLSHDLDALVSKATAKAPEGRYPTMKDFAVALTEQNVSDVRFDSATLVKEVDADQPLALLDRLSETLLHGSMTAATRQTLVKRALPQNAGGTANVAKLTALILGSPEFQRR